MDETVPTLSKTLGAEPIRSKLIADCAGLIDEEVKAKSGFTGVAIKGAYGTVKRIKPRFVTETIDGLLDEWLAQIEPYHQTWRSGSEESFTDFLTARSEDVADDLLSVTDGRAETTKHRTAKKAYEKIRPSAKRNVTDAVPKLGRVVEAYLQAEDGSGSAA
jgi:hypothetical protein